MADEKRSPVGRVYAQKRGEEKIKIGAVWASPFPGNYNITFGDRDIKLSEVLDILEGGGYYINMKLFETKSDDGF